MNVVIKPNVEVPPENIFLVQHYPKELAQDVISNTNQFQDGIMHSFRSFTLIADVANELIDLIFEFFGLLFSIYLVAWGLKAVF